MFLFKSASKIRQRTFLHINLNKDILVTRIRRAHNKMENNYQEIVSRKNTVASKLLNVLIHSKDENVKDTLVGIFKKVLDQDRYTIYPINDVTLASGVWKGKTALITVIGDSDTSSLLKEYVLNGGKIITTDIKLFNELTTEDIELEKKEEKMSINEKPSIREINNSTAKLEEFQNKGAAVLFQDLEPINKESSEELMKIIRLILKELRLYVKSVEEKDIQYTPGYFIGNNEEKIRLVSRWCSGEDYRQKIKELTVQWCKKDELAESEASNTFLPIYLNEFPNNFSYGEYYRNLSSKQIGRLIVYSDVLSSTMDIAEVSLANGVAIVASRQVSGRGRGGNVWITPKGQAAITVQIWQTISPSLSLMQHAAALAVVLAIRKDDYKDLDIRIKWPNDIYYGREVKIGGIVTTVSCMNDDVCVNIGTGVNISNELPTICLNTIIEEYNIKKGKQLKPISIEEFLAKYCSKLEKVLDLLGKDGGVKTFLEEYYKYWLHSGEKVKVKVGDEEPVEGTVSGVDDAGWLVVKTVNGDITTAPDGNTFDMMNGLVAPKL